MDGAPTFYQKLAAAAAQLSYLQKKGHNAHFKYKFVQEAEVKSAVKEALTANGLVLQSVEYIPVGECTGKAAVLRCEVTITDGGKESALYEGIGAGADSSDKAPMKACAAALKYALTSGFLIATGDDPEATDEKDQSTEAPAKAIIPTKAAAVANAATYSTNVALKLTMDIGNKTTLAELDGMLDDLSAAVAKMEKADADIVRAAFKDKRKALEGVK